MSPRTARRARIQAELVLLPPDPERERRRLRAILEQAPAVLVILRGRDLVVESFTPTADRVFGGRLVPGVPIAVSTPELRAQGFIDVMARAYDTGEPFHAREHPVAIDRTGRGELETGYYDLVYHPTRDREGCVDGLMILGVDVTCEVESRRQLERALAVRDEFLAAASHEIGTPLAIIELAVEGLLRSLAERGICPDDRVLRQLERTRRAARRLCRVRDSLLHASRQRSGRLELHEQDLDLGDLLCAVADDLGDLARGSGCELRVEVDGPLRARLDPECVGHAVSCVVENAVKFGAGRPVLVRAAREEAHARIEVEDHGAGISPEHVARIFEPFERASSPRHYGGLGVGLWTASEIVSASGGEIAVTSRPGAGATFTIRLPLTP